jgi:long-chain acyl-CoA synthetase
VTGTQARPDVGTFRPNYHGDPRLAHLIGPGGPFEVTDAVVDGVTVRSFARAPGTIVDCFRRAAAHADRVHLVFEDTRLTFADVRRQALSIARRLKSDYGVGPGDRAAIAMRNYPEFVISFWAAAALGAIPVLLNAWWTGPELRYALANADPAVVFADPERIERIAGPASGPGDPPIIAVRTAVAMPRAPRLAGTGQRLAVFEDLAAGPPLDEGELAAVGPDEVAAILYTSGTTGFPKGALITNRNIIASTMNMSFAIARAYAITGRAPVAAAQPSAISAAPLFHIGGLGSIVATALSGGKISLMRKWDVGEYLELAVREQATSLGGVPATARQVLEHPGAARLREQITSCPLGGAAVPPDLPLRAREVLGDSVQVLNGYGGTETTSAVVTNVGDEYAARPGSVGSPNLTADLRVEDPDGRPLPAGQVGELCFRSPQVVKGYWKDPDATKAAFAGGWFHTGDLGYVDDDGYVYVVDRLKDVVIRGGENVYCAEVEAVLFEHPAVADVTIIGVPDHAMGERVGAVVVPRAGTSVSLDDLRSFAAARLAVFKRPEALYLVDELPRTATGKTDKRGLRAQLLQSSGGALSPPGEPPPDPLAHTPRGPDGEAHQ